MIKAPRKTLLDAAELSARVSSSRQPMAFLSSCGSQLTIRSTDGEAGIQTVIETEGDCDCRLPAAQFAALLKGMRADDVTLEKSGEGTSIFGPAEKFHLRDSDVASLPWENVQGEQVIVPAAALRAAIERCLPAVAADSGRFALNGLYISAADGTLSVCACDGRRSHRSVIADCGINWSGPVSKKTAQTFAKILTEEQATITFGNNNISILCGDRSAWAVTMTGRFPDVAAMEADLIPLVTFDVVASDLVHLAKQSLLVSSTAVWCVAGGVLSLQAAGETGSVDLTIPVPCDGSGVLRVDSRLLLDAFAVHDSMDVLTLSMCADRMIVSQGRFTAIVGAQCD